MPPPTAVLALLTNRYFYTFLLPVMLFALLASGLRWWLKPYSLNVAAAAPALSVLSILGAGPPRFSFAVFFCASGAAFGPIIAFRYEE